MQYLTLSVGLSLLLISSVPMVVLVVAAMVSVGMVAYSIFTHDYQMQRIESFKPLAGPIRNKLPHHTIVYSHWIGRMVGVWYWRVG